MGSKARPAQCSAGMHLVHILATCSGIFLYFQASGETQPFANAMLQLLFEKYNFGGRDFNWRSHFSFGAVYDMQGHAYGTLYIHVCKHGILRRIRYDADILCCCVRSCGTQQQQSQQHQQQQQQEE
ncbi:unnamed protein product, partial [Polarella glacialis]